VHYKLAFADFEKKTLSLAPLTNQKIYERKIFIFFSGDKFEIFVPVQSTYIEKVIYKWKFFKSGSERAGSSWFILQNLCYIRIKLRKRIWLTPWTTLILPIYVKINRKFRVATEIGSSFLGCWQVTGLNQIFEVEYDFLSSV
jgi:hypothetical protein